jgi:hypothetical protein
MPAPVPVTAALGWLATMVPGLRAAAIVDARGAVLAGDGRLAPAIVAGVAPDGVTVARGARHAIAVEVTAPVLDGLLRRDLETALAVLERGADG